MINFFPAQFYLGFEAWFCFPRLFKILLEKLWEPRNPRFELWLRVKSSCFKILAHPTYLIYRFIVLIWNFDKYIKDENKNLHNFYTNI